MERSLHRQIKELYGSAPGARVEAALAGFRIDAIGSDGLLIEVQSAALSPLRNKIEKLLEIGHQIRVVKPIIERKRIVTVDKRSGKVLGTRMSPSRGDTLEIFDEMVGVARWLAEPGFSLELLVVTIEEHRVTRKRRPGYAVKDRTLVETLGSITLMTPDDLWGLLPFAALPQVFTTQDLARALDRPRHFAQKVAYCLRTSGAAEVRGKIGNSHCYAARTRDAKIGDDLERTEPLMRGTTRAGSR